jgi:GrpB-like predicted nucleotidyltransferase (UPF0157 family)
VPGAVPATGIELTDPGPGWPRRYHDLARRIRDALGWQVPQLGHVGSTAVPGLAAKPVIDIDRAVADPSREQDYIPALETTGFQLAIREPWLYGHRTLVTGEPRCNLHAFGFDSPEPLRHRIFRDWLRGNPADRERHAATKPQAASVANTAGAHAMQYNAASSRSSGRSATGRSWPQACSGSKAATHKSAPPRCAAGKALPYRQA